MSPDEQRMVRDRLMAYAARCRNEAKRSRKYKVQISNVAAARAYTIAAQLIPTTEKRARV